MHSWLLFSLVCGPPIICGYYVRKFSLAADPSAAKLAFVTGIVLTFAGMIATWSYQKQLTLGDLRVLLTAGVLASAGLSGYYVAL